MGKTGHSQTLESKEKISDSHKKLWTPERRAWWSERMKGNRNAVGNCPSQGTLLKRSLALKGKPSWTKGKPLSESHRKALSLSQMGHKRGIGRIVSLETKAKIAATVLSTWIGAELRRYKQSLRSRGPMPAHYRRHSWSLEERRRVSERQKIHAKLQLNDCNCPIHNSSVRLGRAMLLSGTRIEKLLETVILAEFPEVITQKEFPPYLVDCYLPPPYHLVFEADGEYWHRFPKKDAARDAYLLRKYGVPVIRLKEKEILEVCRGQS